MKQLSNKGFTVIELAIGVSVVMTVIIGISWAVFVICTASHFVSKYW